jgi:hypothetical protein
MTDSPAIAGAVSADQSRHAPKAASFREEKGVASRVPPDLLGVILLRVELLPHVGRVDVLVALIPPPIHHLGQCRVVRRPFEFREFGRAANASCARGDRGSFSAVLEEAFVAGADGLVDDEEIELIVLNNRA